MKDIISFSKIYAKRAIRVPMIPIFLLIFPIVIMMSVLSGQIGSADTELYQQNSSQLVAGLSIVIILVVTMVNIPITIVNAKTTNLLKQIQFSTISFVSYLFSIFLANLVIAYLAEIITMTMAGSIFKVNFSLLDLAILNVPFITTYIFYFMFGLFIANYCSNLEQSQTIILPIYFALLFISGSFIPFNTFPKNVAYYLTEYNPFYYFQKFLNIHVGLADKFIDFRFVCVVVVLLVLATSLKKNFRWG
ncbi:ABC transporter permease [Bacillus mycoides]|jgi:hypothetical protein|uniref:ABC transporter permease n=1 Tax=Bacillus mycoides TaxID=1405 RepID=UPI001D0D5B8A|nr:ABC transporter permease [Bacillus mycoides]MBE7148410.1 ABC transporter permease [Bacillus mycoides]